MTTKINAINTKHIYPDNNLKTLPRQSASMAFDGRSMNVASPESKPFRMWKSSKYQKKLMLKAEM
jgi:hypothetical protein